jgi:hypothetical protein
LNAHITYEILSLSHSLSLLFCSVKSWWVMIKNSQRQINNYTWRRVKKNLISVKQINGSEIETFAAIIICLAKSKRFIIRHVESSSLHFLTKKVKRKQWEKKIKESSGRRMNKIVSVKYFIQLKASFSRLSCWLSHSILLLSHIFYISKDDEIVCFICVLVARKKVINFYLPIFFSMFCSFSFVHK